MADSWDAYYTPDAPPAADFLSQLRVLDATQRAWQWDMATLKSRLGQEATGRNIVDDLIDLGPDGVEQVRAMVTMDDETLRALVDEWERRDG